MTIETPFANKVTGPEDTDDCFLAPLRNDGELDFALLDVKNSFRYFDMAFPSPTLARKALGSNEVLFLLLKTAFLSLLTRAPPDDYREGRIGTLYDHFYHRGAHLVDHHENNTVNRVPWFPSPRPIRNSPPICLTRDRIILIPSPLPAVGSNASGKAGPSLATDSM